MISYNSSQWTTLMTFKGSVFPKAAKWALFSSLMAVALKALDKSDVVDFNVSRQKLLTQSNGFTLFSATLAFILVFRTSQCYSRFWHCATSVSTMRAQMAEAASSLVTFSIMSKSPPEDVKVFRHTVVRLFSLLHAMCLCTFCDRETHFPLIDMESFEPSHLKALKLADRKERVDVVYMWINALIIKSLDIGLLNVPPPILSRVFHEMEKAMVEYHQVMQVMEIPFPFPYAQMAVVLLVMMVLMTPVAMCYWTDSWISAGILTFIAILCLISLELIADELDNPFGIDDNDLPCEHFQIEMNASLVLLLSGDVGTVPTLKKGALANLEASLKRHSSADFVVSLPDGAESPAREEPPANGVESPAREESPGKDGLRRRIEAEEAPPEEIVAT